MGTSEFSREVVREIIEWDVGSWKHALSLWRTQLEDVSGMRVLDLGARDGGLSLYWALRGCQVICSDYVGPTARAHRLHERYGVTDRVAYAHVDATRIPYADGQFDIISFKSVLGAVGTAFGAEGQKRAIREMHRVLKPTGRLFFAENMAASALHRFFRARFVRWGTEWRYLTTDEIPGLFSHFSDLRLAFRGFAATFGRAEWQRNLLSILDTALDPLTPDRFKYIVFGAATR